MNNPYSDLPDKAFWSPAIAKRSPFDIADLWQAAFPISRETQFATFGSCFAQHFSRKLREFGYKWLNCEQAPRFLAESDAKRFNYGVFSARTANIYTASLLLQWLRWSLRLSEVPDEVWENDNRFFDPFRPAIEPDGFASPEEVRASRDRCLEAVRQSVAEADVFVFTMGLTESWWNADEGFEYPMCPGTVAGKFDATQHVFRNQRHAFIRDTLDQAIELMRKFNPKLNVLLTVSPVPLTATASGDHVLVATSASKSTLRAVANEISQDYDFVDYFPSYEIIFTPPFRGMFFEPNMRSVNPHGVELVMKQFFTGIGAQETGTSDRTELSSTRRPTENTASEPADEVCEEALLASMKQ